ncbi:MAG: hypothetical protein ACOX6T_26130, partial [Myxococcales bacterium]
APYLLEEVGEFLIGKQVPAVSMQQGVDRVRRQPLGTESRRIPKQVSTSRRTAKTHGAASLDAARIVYRKTPAT